MKKCYLMWKSKPNRVKKEMRRNSKNQMLIWVWIHQWVRVWVLEDKFLTDEIRHWLFLLNLKRIRIDELTRHQQTYQQKCHLLEQKIFWENHWNSNRKWLQKDLNLKPLKEKLSWNSKFSDKRLNPASIILKTKEYFQIDTILRQTLTPLLALRVDLRVNKKKKTNLKQVLRVVFKLLISTDF